jgi:hypothetical protein
MRLLDRQVRLLDYLTSSGAIFGGDGNATFDPVLQGMDPGLLRLEARFSHEKRMEKITAVFPKTCRLLGVELAAIVQEFVEAWPPTDITRIENARQFYEALSSRWRRLPPQPPYLQDVAACEFGIARARIGHVHVDAPPDSDACSKELPGGAIRRAPEIILLRCAYDIRSVVEDDAEGVTVVKRDTPLVIAIPPGAAHPAVFEVLPPVYDLLAVLDGWTARSALETASELDELVSELAQYGLVEVHG